MSMRLLRVLIRETILQEIDINSVENVCFTTGSTHVMKTCKIGNDKYFLKFSEEKLFKNIDPSLQILVEYLAYRIYGLFAGIRIPLPQLVYDTAGRKVGLATSAVKGKMALRMSDMNNQLLAKMMSQGVYVDIFLCNWDVIGTDSGNVFIDDDVATRIDPGGSLTFRAQGGRKGKAFGPNAKELKSMLDPSSGAGQVFMHADLAVAAKEFLEVDWPAIESEIDTVRNEINDELEERAMNDLFAQWNEDVNLIKGTLKERHSEVKAHAINALQGS